MIIIKKIRETTIAEVASIVDYHTNAFNKCWRKDYLEIYNKIIYGDYSLYEIYV